MKNTAMFCHYIAPSVSSPRKEMEICTRWTLKSWFVNLNCVFFFKVTSDESWLWHRCLAHLNFKYIKNLVTGVLVWGMPLIKFDSNTLCDACECGDISRNDIFWLLTLPSRNLRSCYTLISMALWLLKLCLERGTSW